MGESSSQVDSDLDIIPPSTSPTKNGKRGAEKVVEPQVVGSKKQKVVNGDVESIKEEQHSSSLSDQEQQKNKVEVPSSIKSPTILQEPEKASSCNEFEQDDGDDTSNKENDPHMGTPMQSVEVPSPLNSTATLHEAKKASSSNEFEQDDGDDNSRKENDLHMGMKSVELPPAIKSATLQDAERTSISNEHEEEEDRDDSSKEVYMATERTEHTVTTSRATGSKTLFLGNLSFAIEEDDVRDFFKDVGEIAAIRFVIRDDRFLGYGYIEFTTAEAAQEALKLNKEVLLDRKVRLELTMERGAYTPNNSMEKPYRRGVQAQGRTIYIRGFDSSVGFDNIKSALEKHFGKCGEISRMSIPRDYEFGVAKGIAFIDFADRNGVRQALRLDGSEVAGSRLTIEEAKRQKGDVREGIGYGYGLRNWIRGSGSGGSWVRDGGSASGSGRGNASIGGWGRENASGYDSVRESGSVGGLHRESGYGSGRGRESGYGSSRGRESGYGNGSGRESGYGNDSRRVCGSGGSWHRDNVSGRPRESVSGSASHRESGCGRGPHREGGAGGSWHRESGSGRGWHGVSSIGHRRGNENSYGRGEGRGSGYGRAGFGSSLGYRGGRSGPISSGFGRSGPINVGGGSGWGGGSGYSSGRVGGGVSGYSSSFVGGGSAYRGSRTDRFSGGYGSGRGGGFSRP